MAEGPGRGDEPVRKKRGSDDGQTHSPEFLAFTKAKPELVEQLSFSFLQLQDQCQAVGLITFDEVQANFGGRGATPAEETSLLLEIILSRIRADPSLYSKFIRLPLLRDPTHRTLVTRMGRLLENEKTKLQRSSDQPDISGGSETDYRRPRKETKSPGDVLEEAAQRSDIARENLQLITRKFASLIRQVCRSLRMQNAHVGDLKAYIIHLLKSKSLTACEIVGEATTIDELFIAIRKLGLWDYLHVTLLEAIIEEYTVEDPNLQNMLQGYQQELAAFKLSTMLDTYIQFMQPSGEASQSAVGEGLLPKREPNPVFFTTLTVKTEANVTERSLEYIDKLEKKVAQFMSIPPMALLLDKIAEGCVCVTWHIPKEFSSQAARAVKDKKNLVETELGAVRIAIGSEQVYCGTSEEVEDHHIQVPGDSKEMVGTFAQLVLAVYRLLCRHKVDLEEVRMSFLFMGCCRRGTSQEHLRMFSDSSDIARTPSLSSLIQSLHKYSSWFNYRLIKFVAEEFGGDDGKKLIEDYEDKLKHYYETVIAYQCPQFCLSDGIPEGYEVLEVKVGWDYRTCPVKDVVLFRDMLSELLGLEPHVFLLKSLEEGRVLMKWAVPAVVAPHILTEVYGHSHKLAEVPVVYVQIMGKCIEITGDKENYTPKQPFVAQLSPKGSMLTRLTATGSTTSTGSYLSVMSELTWSTSKKSSQNEVDQAVTCLSPLSQIMDIAAETADEVEILSKYSSHACGSSSSLAVSRPSGSWLSDEFEKLSTERSDSISSLPQSEESASVSNDLSRPQGKRKGANVFKWIAHLLQPFQKRHSDANESSSSPPKQPLSFPILPLSMEPCAQQGFHYYHTDKDMEMHEQGKGPPGYPEQREAEGTLWIPQLYINSTPVDTPVEPDTHNSGISCKTLTISELASSVSSQECDFLLSHLPLPVAGSSSHSISLSSPSSGYGISSAVISMEASPSASMSLQFTSQLSEENESNHFSSSPSESHRFPRLRTNSAPYRLHGIHRKPSVAKGSDEVHRRTLKRNHSTNASDYRSISPAIPMCRETSDYFSTSDIGGSSIPHTPTSHYNSQTISEDSFVLTPTMQRKQFPEYLPVHRHSMNSRSRYQVPTGSFPLSVSSHGIVQPETS